jgi:colanic acid/amylovoran biosynthesis protein
MRMFSPKIIITGSSLSGNKGSMAMTLVFVEEIRRMIPGCQISLVSKYPKQDRSVADRIGIDLVPAPPVKLVTLTLLRAWLSVVFKSIPTSKWSDPVLLAYQRSDLLVDLGGVTFSGDRDWRGLLLSIAFLTPALAVGLPAAKLAQAMGPFNRGIVKITAKFFLSRCALLVARGIYTAENLRNLLGPDACHQCSDLAFY